jgi:hypothetical protein
LLPYNGRILISGHVNPCACYSLRKSQLDAQASSQTEQMTQTTCPKRVPCPTAQEQWRRSNQIGGLISQAWLTARLLRLLGALVCKSRRCKLGTIGKSFSDPKVAKHLATRPSHRSQRLGQLDLLKHHASLTARAAATISRTSGGKAEMLHTVHEGLASPIQGRTPNLAQ